MPEITLYRGNGACSLIPHIVLRELGVPFQSVVLKWSDKGFQFSSDGNITGGDYRKIHSSGYVPALQVDDEVITENPAILMYLASLAPERNLAGKGDLERAHVVEWLVYLSGSLHGYSYGMLFAPKRFTDDTAQYDAIRQKGRAKIEECYALIDKRLEGREFPVGDGETLVDFNLVIFYYWGRDKKFDMDRYPNYGSVVKRMEAKESLQEAAKDEGINLFF